MTDSRRGGGAKTVGVQIGSWSKLEADVRHAANRFEAATRQIAEDQAAGGDADVQHDRVLPRVLGTPKIATIAIIGWSHNLAVFQRCRDPLEREFYLRMTAKFGWTKAVLIHQIENQSYEKTLLGQTNFDRALTPKLRAQAKLAVKDDYTFDFLELGEQHSERDLGRALIARIEQFFRAMGGLFAFVGSQDDVVESVPVIKNNTPRMAWLARAAAYYVKLI